jgi:predicted cupin superfamily sugar epimerase
VSNPPLSADEVVELLQLSPLPGEGGFFREMYRSDASIPTALFSAPYAGEQRRASTAIYYLLTADTYSALHRLLSDEVYHFYRGDAVELTLLDDQGRLETVFLGGGFEKGEHCQFVVPAGVWQGSRLRPGGRWALMGTTVAPGFEFCDCTLADAALLDAYPQHAERLKALLA